MIRKFSDRATFAMTMASLALVSAACSGRYTVPAPARTVAAITPADVRVRIYLVADDSMKGRAAGAMGNFVMTSYLAKEMARLGLEPGGEDGTWFQTIPMVRRSVDSASTLSVKGEALRLFGDYALIRPTATVRFSTTFPAGTYGTIYGGRAGDSSVALAASDVAGRIIVLDAPNDANGQPTSVFRPRGQRP